MADIERIYTVPLKKAYETSRTFRARRAINVLRAFLARHMKAEEEKVKLGGDVNSYILSSGIKKPPRKIKVKVVKDAAGVVKVTLVTEAKTKAAPVAKKEERKPAPKMEKAKEAPKPKEPQKPKEAKKAPEKKEA